MCRLIAVYLLSLLLCACANNGSSSHKPAIVVPEPNYERAAEINVQLGLTYLQKNDMPRAKQKLLQAMQQNPNSATVNGAMGYFAERTGDIDDAERYYQRAVDLATNKGASENNYATFLCRQKRYDDADKYFQLATNDPQYLNTDKAYENAGRCAMLIPDLEKAQQYFLQAVQKNPRLAEAWLQLANLAYSVADYAKARSYLMHYLALNTEPDPATLWMAVRLAQAAGDTAAMNQYGAQLQSKFPTSSQAADYRQLQASLR